MDIFLRRTIATFSTKTRVILKMIVDNYLLIGMNMCDEKLIKYGSNNIGDNMEICNS